MERKTIFRSEKTFVEIEKALLTDNRITFKAKGIMAYLATLPDGPISLTGLLPLKNSLDGVRSIEDGIRELEEQGYLERGSK